MSGIGDTKWIRNTLSTLSSFIVAHLVVPDLSCCIWDLSVFTVVCRIFQLQHVGSSSLTRDRIWFPHFCDRGIYLFVQ